MAGRFIALALLLAAAPALGAREIPTNYAFALQWGSATTSGPSKLDNPMGIAVSRDRTKAFVCDTNNTRIAVFNPDSGKFISSFGSAGTGPGQFAAPVNIAVSPRTSHLYVTDPLNSRIVCYDEEGVFIRNFGEAGSGPGQFDGVVDVGVDDSGNVYVLTNTRMQKYSGWGKYLMEWSLLAASDPNTFAPGGMGINQKTREVYVLDYANDWVKRYNGMTGKFMSMFGGAGVFGETVAISADALGGVYVLDVNGTTPPPAPTRRARRALLQGAAGPTMRIQKFVGATGQQVVAFASCGTGLGQMVDPVGITSTRNGFEVFATDSTLDRVLKFSLPLNAGGWADPHFQGFDGVRFDEQAPAGSWLDILAAPSSKFSLSAKLATGLMPGSSSMVDVAFTLASAKYRGALVKNGTTWALTATLNGKPLKVGTSFPVAGTKVVFFPGKSGTHGRLQIDAGVARIVVAQMWRADKGSLADYVNVGITLRGRFTGDVSGVLAPSYYEALKAADDKISAAAVGALMLIAGTA
ncbi:hypothetical protein ABPG75_001667 [Micractinium tetrahymenae]